MSLACLSFRKDAALLLQFHIFLSYTIQSSELVADKGFLQGAGRGAGIQFY